MMADANTTTTTTTTGSDFDASSLHQWLRSQTVTSDAYDPSRLLRDFLAEMEAGLSSSAASSSSSLAMIPSHVSVASGSADTRTGSSSSSSTSSGAAAASSSALPPDRTVAVIDAGGTNLRVCLVRTDESGQLLFDHRLQLYHGPMPGRTTTNPHHPQRTTTTAADFYRILVNHLAPHAHKFEVIGFCFSYPAEIALDEQTGDIDGRLTHWTKEVVIDDMVGTRVGRGLVEALAERTQGRKRKRVVVLNDTVACLLAGLSQGKDKEMDASSYVGFILGTGTNTSYVQRNAGIAKLQGMGTAVDPDATQVVNVESGGFSAFSRSPIDVELDKGPDEPRDEALAGLDHRGAEGSGTHMFEKAISGQYLGTIALALLHKLASQHPQAFSEGGRAAIRKMGTLTNAHASNFCRGDRAPDQVGGLASEALSASDRDVVRTVYQAVVDRAALFAAVNILAAVIKSGEGRDAARPVCVTIDGTTYERTCGLKENVQERLARMARERGLHVRCIAVEEAPLVGAAIAALTGLPDRP